MAVYPVTWSLDIMFNVTNEFSGPENLFGDIYLNVPVSEK